MPTAPTGAATLSDVLLDKLRAAWRRPDLTVDAQPAGEGVTISIRPRRAPPYEYTYAVERHVLPHELRPSAVDDLIRNIVQDMDNLPVLEQESG
jgi:hypothetical protein